MRTLATVLDTGLGWLYDTAQPDDAHADHHGIVLGLPDVNRVYRFTPDGADHLPVVIVNVARPGPPGSNPLEPGELFDLAIELEARGYTVRTTWNGHPADTGSVSLIRPAHPTLVAAVERYHRGCTVHPERTVFCDCEHWRAEYARRVRPPYPAA